MNVKEVIEHYKESQTMPSKCHLNWLKENFNPILKSLNSRLNISWGCSNCVRNYMHMLCSWYDTELEKEAAVIKKVVKKKKKTNKKNVKQTKK
tara:strand:+ start:1141 stop:1419 length:279 start_codon:yes stop_codon:yes gene_type:complete